MITGIIMASGFSKRMKTNKLTIEIDGVKIIERVIKAALESNLDDIILVYRTEEIRLIGEKYNLNIIYNPVAHLGQSASVVIGTKNSDLNSALMYFVADQPFLTTQVINRLILEYNENEGSIVIPYFKNVFGMPIIFPPRFRQDLQNVLGDRGGREIIYNNPDSVRKVHFKDEILGMDMDKPEDIQALE